MDQGVDLIPRAPRVLPAIFLAGALALAAPAAAEAPTIRLDADAGAVEAAGLDPELLAGLDALTAEDWRAVFAVYTGTQPPADGTPAVAGSWTVEGGAVRFRPRFPLVAGLAYTARLDLARLERLATGEAGRRAPVVATFSLPKAETEPSTVVRAVYPTASELPANLLKLYLHFSAPMSRGEATRQVRLEDAGGRPLEGAFLEVGEELWDAGQRRLTLFFDPGRIKRGLRPHLEAGPPLSAGGRYRLVIDPAWRDARGLPLARGHDKAFTASAADRASPDPAGWRLSAPAPGGREPLELRFPEPLDHALLERVVRVRGPGDERVAGRAEVGDGERSWRFVPDAPWRAGDHAIEVETILEDLAGNNLRTLFDVDLAAPPPPGADGDVIALPFTVASP